MTQLAQGKFFDDLEVGMVFKHAIHRTVTETDNLMFTVMTMNTQPLHLDEEFSKNSIAGTRMVNSLFTLGLVMGLGTSEVWGGSNLANLKLGDIAFPKPVVIGDTLRAETEVIAVSPAETRSDAGVVHFEHRGYNQRGEMVARVGRTALLRKRPLHA